jgi:mRNA interferase HicA
MAENSPSFICGWWIFIYLCNVIKKICFMKYSEFHRLIKANGWGKCRQSGSHVVYEKNGVKATVPDHGSKEMHEWLRRKPEKDMSLK